MIDPKIIKENQVLVKEMLVNRNMDFPLDALFNADKQRRDLIVELQHVKHQKNVLSKEISERKKRKEDVSSKIHEMSEIGMEISRLEEESRINEESFSKYIRSLPNFFHETVPLGKDENDNKITREYNGKLKVIKKPTDGIEKSEKEIIVNKEVPGILQIKNHIDLTDGLGLIDLERAGKISGSRFYFLKNEMVKLSMALANFATDYLIKEGYTVVQPPFMIRRDAMEGAVILSDFEETIYKIENEDLYMIGTSEHPLASMHMNEILNGKNLPIRYGGISTCFRKEAGAHGKDMKGLFRVHQFEKVEQFVFCKPEESWKEHERLLQITEKFYEILEIPFRTIILCSGDLGKVSAKTYDIEAWFPAQNSYREICSCSNCTDYQARSLRIRYRNNPNDQTSLVHTLNSTLVAIQRTLVAILENYQTVKGTIIVPEALKKYMGGIDEIGK
ncbi:Serine--tRNA ligase [Candidatus Nitrosocosmicus oleophilus]|uniref:Serine--tRNA ligase n=1 Tax=Candidatus Nitrosocosmicus oleophilus TaxID=1353260 RepID=A0A654ME20_9ARCH|nr:serine--tRNA ligase [Candidatus Nitrosocosmicus oleophilus]ALI37732.1 Serine--tRNA ligase [Candidatus Nitrosocosmicus oleophilus]